MMNQPENGDQQTATSELDASKQAITELSDEQLEEVAGGLSLGRLFRRSKPDAAPGGAAPKGGFMSDVKSGLIQGAAFIGLEKLIGG